MKLALFVFAEYAANTQDNKLVIAGAFNTLSLHKQSPPPGDAKPVWPLPFVYLAAVVQASIGEGLKHSAELRVLDDDGAQIFDPISLGDWNFTLTITGRPMQFQAVILVNGIPMPGPGEYSFELWVDGNRLGETALYVDEIE